MQQIPGGDGQAEGRYRTTLVIYFALFSSIGVLLLLTLAVIERPADVADNRLLTFLFGAIGAFNVVISLVLKQRIISQAVEKGRADMVQAAYVVAFALSDSASLFGLMLFFLTPGASFYVLFAIAATGMLLHFPRRDHFYAAAQRKSL